MLMVLETRADLFSKKLYNSIYQSVNMISKKLEVKFEIFLDEGIQIRF
jgi:hypothetical protein